MRKHVRTYLKHHNIGIEDLWYCENCGTQEHIYNLDIHHIVHRSQMGTDEPENLMCVCRRCHSGHHDRGHELERNYKLEL
jgi:5-methylcytosine-specific restriction endonuclease McrA